MVKLLVVTILGSLISAVLYRLGGWGGEGRDRFPNLPKWFFNTKARDIGCAIVGFGAYSILVGITLVPWYIHLVCFLLLFGSLTTYWDWITGEDNHWLHGLACGVSYVPYAFYMGDWHLYLGRAVAVAVLMGLVSWLSGNDVVEETGRGASLIATLPILTL